MNEQIFDLVTPYRVGRNQQTLVVLIPKEAREALGIKAYQKLYVKSDENGRLIYEIVKGDIKNRIGDSEEEEDGI